MDPVNRKIIDAVIEKANRVCPEALALIGIYGSAATGDTYPKSDLDLLILIENEEGRKLGTGFILEDTQVGYDIYCTDWDALSSDALCRHAHLSKLLDAKIVYVRNPKAREELLELQNRAKEILSSDLRFQTVDQLLDQAKIHYANACLQDTLGQVRLEAFGVIYRVLDALMIFHGTYFRRGVKRTFEELAALPLEEAFFETVRQIARCGELGHLRELLKELILMARDHTRREPAKSEPSGALAGTYEEMFSNWRNKVEEAAEKEDVFACFMNMCSLQLMLAEISAETEIGDFRILDQYNPDYLGENVKIFDESLRKYEKAYQQAGISIKKYADVDAFVADYLSQ